MMKYEISLLKKKFVWVEQNLLLFENSKKVDGGHRGDAANIMVLLKKGLKMSPLVLLMTADAVAETLALRGREYLSDAETNLLEFKPEFKKIVEKHLTPTTRSNGVAHPRRVELSGD